MKLLALIMLNFLAFGAWSQSVEETVIGTSGKSFESNNILLDWTMGEVMITTLHNPTSMISQGFHQPGYQLVSVDQLPEEVLLFEAHPNPVSTYQNFSLDLKNSTEVILRLYDVNGSIVWEKKANGKNIREVIHYDHLSSGQFFLSAFIHQYQVNQSIQVVKTN